MIRGDTDEAAPFAFLLPLAVSAAREHYKKSIKHNNSSDSSNNYSISLRTLSVKTFDIST